MAVPKKRMSKASRNMRRSHHAYKATQLATCPRCKQLVPGHTACPNCGMYNGRQVIDVLAKLNKEERKQRQKQREKQ